MTQTEKYADNPLAINLMNDGVDIDGPRFVLYDGSNFIVQTDNDNEVTNIVLSSDITCPVHIDLDIIRKEYLYGFGFFYTAARQGIVVGTPTELRRVEPTNIV